jgi:hypothetical protein
MSTWISKLALCCLLAGCIPVVDRAAPARPASILGGEMIIAAPRGYCVNDAASQQAEDSAVVIMGRCSDAGKVPPAVITATVGTAGSAAVLASGPEQLTQYFASPEGLAALSRTGDPAAVQVTEILSVDDAILLNLTDSAIGDYWRAVLGLRGRVVTLAVTPPSGLPLKSAEGRRLLDRTIAAIRSANPEETP